MHPSRRIDEYQTDRSYKGCSKIGLMQLSSINPRKAKVRGVGADPLDFFKITFDAFQISQNALMHPSAIQLRVYWCILYDHGPTPHQDTHVKVEVPSTFLLA